MGHETPHQEMSQLQFSLEFPDVQAYALLLSVTQYS